MSDEFNKANYTFIWDELYDENEQQADETIGLTLSQFQKQYGFDQFNIFTHEIELTTENETSPSTNFGSDAPSSSNVIPPSVNHIPEMPYNKEFLDVILTYVGDFIVNVQHENKKTVAKILSDINKFKRCLMSKAETKRNPPHRTNST
ncbi:hypothetical protein DPMN_067705 [Dreissena polymorpha]|uniref:Uncharacterized protein n=1 Tax=Dreissena polymorpha TaxID=45954 RepID=A0A9D4BW13_DREPO|nr:hypothetical protein DPMN_067705 [Dreissena polymorpha]